MHIYKTTQNITTKIFELNENCEVDLRFLNFDYERYSSEETSKSNIYQYT